MNRTTKIALAIGGVIVLSYPGIAWVTGMAIESRMQHSEQQALDQVPYLTLVKREYHRGVYRSTEIATYGFHLPVTGGVKTAAALPSSATFTVVNNIRHGPFPAGHAGALAVVVSTLVVPAPVEKTLSGVLGTRPVLQAHTTVSLFGGAATALTSPAFRLVLADGSALAWAGLTGTIRTARNQAGWTGQLSAPRLVFQGARGMVEFAGLEYSGSNARAFGGLYLGTGTLTIERLGASSPRPDEGFSVQRLSVTSTSKPDGEFFDERTDLTADAATFAAVKVKNIAYSVSFEHLDGPSFASLLQALRSGAHEAVANPVQGQTTTRNALRQYGANLLLHDPVLDIPRAGFTMPEGSFLLSAKIRARGLASADLQWPAAFMALKTHAEVTADLRVDNGLVQKFLTMGGSNPRFATQLTSFEQQGYLTAGASAVTTHIDYSGGRLTLNGHAFPPAAPTD